MSNAVDSPTAYLDVSSRYGNDLTVGIYRSKGVDGEGVFDNPELWCDNSAVNDIMVDVSRGDDQPLILSRSWLHDLKHFD